MKNKLKNGNVMQEKLTIDTNNNYLDKRYVVSSLKTESIGEGALALAS